MMSICRPTPPNGESSRAEYFFFVRTGVSGRRLSRRLFFFSPHPCIQLTLKEEVKQKKERPSADHIRFSLKSMKLYIRLIFYCYVAQYKGVRSKHLVPAMQGLANAYTGLGKPEESLKVLIRAYQIASVTPDVLERQDAEALAAQNGAFSTTHT